MNDKRSWRHDRTHIAESDIRRLRHARQAACGEQRVKDMRRHRQIPVFDPEGQQVEGWLKQAASYLGVTSPTVRKQVELGKVAALQPVSGGLHLVHLPFFGQNSSL